MTAHPETPAWTPEEEARAVRVLAEFMGWKPLAREADASFWSVPDGSPLYLPTWNPFQDANAEQQVAARALEVMTAEQLARVGNATDTMWARRSHDFHRSRCILLEDWQLHVLQRTGDRARAIYQTLTNEAR